MAEPRVVVKAGTGGAVLEVAGTALVARAGEGAVAPLVGCREADAHLRRACLDTGRLAKWSDRIQAKWFPTSAVWGRNYEENASLLRGV